MLPERAHKPHQLGPRLERRGRWWTADLRPWRGQRYTTLRNPKDPGWPARGERTEDADIADRWKWAYVDCATDVARQRQLGRRRSGRPLGEAVHAFLSDRELRYAYCTARSNATPLRVHLLPAFGEDVSVDVIDRQALQGLFDRLAREGYRPGTLQQYRLTILSFYSWLGRTDEDNPAHAIELPDPGNVDARTFSDEELSALRAGADDIDSGRVVRKGHRCPFPMRRAIELGLGVGGRQAELFALEWPALNERKATVRLAVQLARNSTDGGSGLTPLKSGEARTALVLPSWWEHHDRRARGRVLGCDTTPPARLLHASFRWINYLYDHVELNAMGQAWHSLRHTYSRVFIESGGRLEELQKSLGHASIQTTEQYYGHFSEDSAAELARQRIYGTGATGRGLHSVGTP